MCRVPQRVDAVFPGARMPKMAPYCLCIPASFILANCFGKLISPARISGHSFAYHHTLLAPEYGAMVGENIVAVFDHRYRISEIGFDKPTITILERLPGTFLRIDNSDF